MLSDASAITFSSCCRFLLLLAAFFSFVTHWQYRAVLQVWRATHLKNSRRNHNYLFLFLMDHMCTVLDNQFSYNNVLFISLCIRKKKQTFIVVSSAPHCGERSPRLGCLHTTHSSLCLLACSFGWGNPLGSSEEGRGVGVPCVECECYRWLCWWEVKSTLPWLLLVWCCAELLFYCGRVIQA